MKSSGSATLIPTTFQWVLRVLWKDDDSSGSYNERRLPSMEGLRGFAVLLVFCVHFYVLFGFYAQHTPFWRTPTRFLGNIGNVGVDLFFVLSGYLIYGILLEHRTTVSQFLKRRLERIYPTFLAVFGLYLVVSAMAPGFGKFQGYSRTGGVIYIVQNLLLMPGVFNIPALITVSWSLSYEMFFYILAALLVTITQMWEWRQRLRVLFIGGIWCSYCIACFMISRSLVRSLMFAVGALLYEALISRRFRIFLSQRGEVLALLFFLGSLGLAYMLDVEKDNFESLPRWWAGRNSTPGVTGYQGPYKTAVLSVSIF